MANELAHRVGQNLLQLVASEAERAPRLIVAPTDAELQFYAREARRLERKWASEFGEPYPANLDDLRRQASRAGVSFEQFQNASEAEIFAWIEGYLLRLRDERGANAAFVPSAIQGRIMVALNGVALKTDALAKACRVDPSTLYKPNGLPELRKAGLVAHKTTVGNYRPDAPPANAIGKK